MTRLIAISGKASSGKDAAAEYIKTTFGFTQIAFADDIKHVAKHIFGFSEETLWGPSSLRGVPDTRYLRATHAQHDWEDMHTSADPDWPGAHFWRCQRCTETFSSADIAPVCKEYVSARLALQGIGELMKTIYPRAWLDKTLRTIHELLADTGTQGVVLSDLRFKHEFETLRAIEGARIIRVTRPNSGLPGAFGADNSEMEQEQIPDSAFDAVIQNDSDLEALHHRVDAIIQSWA